MGKIKDKSTPYGITAVTADYKEQVIEEYKGNPLIEALPPIFSKFEVVDKLAVYPYFDEEERTYESHYRAHLIQRLFQYFQPLSIHLDLESRISRILRQGYLSRNPISTNYVRNFHKGYDAIESKDIALLNNEEFNTVACGFSIIGPSGIGKTTAIRRVFSTIPQVIVHSEYCGRKLNMHQLVWLKLDCPYDGSIKSLCNNFFISLDNILGTNYYKKFSNGRVAANTMLPVMCQLALHNNLGILIIDEIQHLSLAKSGGAEKMLNFFCTLVNSMNIPVILVGTNKAMSIIQSDFRQARRGVGNQGNMIFDRMQKDENWNLVVEGMWDYQWTRKVTGLTQELNDALYEESCGIPDLLIKLYALAQIRSISKGTEEVNVKIIKEVAQECLQPVKPMLDALKSGNINKIIKYEDISPINIDDFLNKEVNSISLNNKIKELQNLKRKKLEESIENKKEQAILKLIELDIEYNKAKKYINKIIEEMGESIEVKELVKEAYRLTLGNESQNITKNNKSKNIKSSNKNDLRFLVAEGKKNGLTAYEALKNIGHIKNYDKDICKVV
jgi:hypothetical protein